MAAKIYDLVLPGLTADGTINPELQKKVLEFVFKVQGIKEPAVAEKIYDFASGEKNSRRSRCEKVETCALTLGNKGDIGGAGSTTVLRKSRDIMSIEQTKRKGRGTCRD